MTAVFRMSDLSLIKFRDVRPEIKESDLLDLLKPFGVVGKIQFEPNRQAVARMVDVDAAQRALHYYNSVPPSVRGRNISILLAAQEHSADRSSHLRNSFEASRPKRVLSVTIEHMIHPVTVDVLYKVFKTCGVVEKIRINEHNGSHALIQYQSHQEALEAYKNLHGMCIFDGCCQLAITFTETGEEVKVCYNDDQSRDFTNLSLPKTRLRRSKMERGAVIAVAYGGTLPLGVTGLNEWCTLIVSNLNTDKLGEDKLFNLFSLYGKIVRIRICRSESDCAHIEMADGLQAELAMHYLKGAPLFGKNMELKYSKEYHSTALGPESKDFSHSSHNRFSSHCVRDYRFCCAPTKTIYISRLPVNITEEAVHSHLCQHGSTAKILLSSVRGWAQAHVLFDTEEEATEALVSKHVSYLNKYKIWISFSQNPVHLPPKTNDVILTKENELQPVPS